MKEPTTTRSIRFPDALWVRLEAVTDHPAEFVRQAVLQAVKLEEGARAWERVKDDPSPGA